MSTLAARSAGDTRLVLARREARNRATTLASPTGEWSVQTVNRSTPETKVERFSSRVDAEVVFMRYLRERREGLLSLRLCELDGTQWVTRSRGLVHR